MLAGQRRSDLEQVASRKQSAGQQQSSQGGSGSAQLLRMDTAKPLKAPVTRMSDFDFHLQHVYSPPPEHAGLEIVGHQQSPADPASTTAIRLDLQDSQLHKSELMQALGMSPPMEGTTNLENLSIKHAAAAASSQAKTELLDPLADPSSSPKLDTRSAVVLRKLAAASYLPGDHRPCPMGPGKTPGPSMASASGSVGQPALEARPQAQLHPGDASSNLSKQPLAQSRRLVQAVHAALRSKLQAGSLDGKQRTTARKLAAALNQQEQALALKVQPTVVRNPEAQTVAAAASERRHAGSIKEQETIKPVQKPQLPIDVIVHWYDAWQLDDLNYGPPEAALIDLV